MPFARVALPIPLRQTFAYRIPDALTSSVRPGTQVSVPFRGRPRRGIVVAVEARSDRDEVRDLAAVVDGEPLSAHLMALAAWVADYYVAPLGEVLAMALPGGLAGFAGSRARRRAVEDPALRLALPERRALTVGQRGALAAVERALAIGGFEALLLHGVTGSGKTEVYLRAAQAAREAGGQTLLLVPEVALGSQIVAEVRRRFARRVGVLHSYLTVGERRATWELARRGALDVVVGARSAVFAPLPALRLVVVDEEHEHAYKQGEQVRYHGRDTAVRRAQMLGIPVVLGSATPSLETLANAARGKYRRVRLPERVQRRPLPRVHVVDLRRETGPGLLSPALHAALQERLSRGEQALMFLNRRGHSRHVQCRACGFTAQCPFCDIALTLHLQPAAWRCHYCDHREAARAGCPSCGQPLLRHGSGGTQRAERELAQAFPGARILRLDTDVTRARTSPQTVLDAFREGRADVLVGTQMIAKGLDFPRVTLVGVLDADLALHLPDFRAAERTFQLLVQVSGRSGRGPRPGEVVIQTCTPDHHAVAAAARHDQAAFVESELAQRREAGYPPYTRLAAIRFAGRDAEAVERAAEAAVDRIREAAEQARVTVLGPAPQPLARLRGLYRWHALLKGFEAAAVRRVAVGMLDRADEGRARTVRVLADIDPVDVL